MTIAVHYKGYFLRRIPSRSHNDLPSHVLVQISKSENCKPFVELYSSDGLSSGLRWIDRELPQLSGNEQAFKNTDVPQKIYSDFLKAQQLMAVLKSSAAASERSMDFAEHLFIRSRKLSALARPH